MQHAVKSAYNDISAQGVSIAAVPDEPALNRLSNDLAADQKALYDILARLRHFRDRVDGCGPDAKDVGLLPGSDCNGIIAVLRDQHCTIAASLSAISDIVSSLERIG